MTRIKAANRGQPVDARIHTIFNAMPEGFCLFQVEFDEKGQANDLLWLEVNPAFETQSGLRNVQGKRTREVLPQLEASWYDIYGKVALTGEPIRFEDEAKELRRWFEVSAYRAGGPDSRQVGVLFNDITERRLGEERRQESEKRYRELFETSPVAIMVAEAICDAEGRPNNYRFLHVNPAFERFVRMKAADIVGRTAFEFNPRSDRAWVERQGRVALTGVADHWEGFSVLADTWFEATAYSPKPGQLVTHFIDIGERKRAEEDLRLSEERFREAFHLSPAGLAITRIADGTIVEANDTFLRMFEFAREQVLGRTSVELAMLTTQERSRIIQQQLETGGVRDFEMQARTRSGRVLDLLASSQAMENKGEAFHITHLVDITERRRTEQQMARFGERLALATRAARLGIWDWDVVNDRLVWDEGMYKLYGVRPEEFAGAHEAWVQGLHPGDRVRCESESAQALRGEGEYESEFRVTWPDGTVRHLAAQGAVIRGEGGRPLRMVGVNYDITERIQAQEALREREYLLSASQRAAHIGTWSWRVQDAKVYWSDETYRIYGLSPDMGRPDFEFFFELVYPDDQAKLRNWASAVVAGLHPPPVEFRALRPDGTFRVIRTEGDVIETVDGATSRIAGTAYDVTERERANEILRASEERYRTLFEQAPDGIVIADSKGYYTDVNPAICRMMGYSREEMLTLHASDIVVPEEIPHIGPAFATVAAEIPYHREWQFRRKDGSVFTAEAAATRMPDGRPLGIIRDITERKEAERRISQLQAELEQRVVERTAQLNETNRELEAFSYSVSHDLRAPLRAIDGFSRIVQEDYASRLDDEGRDSLARIRAAAQRMAQLIEDLLRLSRIGRVELNREPVDLSAMARAIALELKQREPKRAVEVSVAGGLSGNGDPRLLRVALENLLGNAWKFTARREHARIDFGAETQDEQTTYFVRDNGAGFDEAHAAKLFGAFQRLHGSEEFAGTGIGLATVQRIVSRHGGRVWAKGKVGQGATFWFDLGGGAETRRTDP